MSDESESEPPLRIVQSDDEYRRRVRRDEHRERVLTTLVVLAAIVLIGLLVWLFVEAQTMSD